MNRRIRLAPYSRAFGMAIVLATLGAGMPHAAGGPQGATAADPCDDAKSTLQMQQCLARTKAGAEGDVATSTARLRSLVAARQPRSAKLVDADARSWTAFVEAHCTLVGAGMAGGSAQPIADASCRNDLARRRAADLISLIEDWSR